MTKKQAIKMAADWWIEQIRSRNWDNGDADTENMRALFASRMSPLSESDLGVVRECIEGLYATQDASETFGAQLYSDYGCAAIDEACKARGVKFSSLLQGPQKAGATIKKKGDEFIVMAKSGYRRAWVELAKQGNAK